MRVEMQVKKSRSLLLDLAAFNLIYLFNVSMRLPCIYGIETGCSSYATLSLDKYRRGKVIFGNE